MGSDRMSKLFSPISFSGLTLRNRIVMPPMATASQPPGGAVKDDGVPGKPTIKHYKERAAKGLGMIIVEHTYVSKKGKAHRNQLGIDKDKTIPAFAELVHAIKVGGAVASIQLSHAGAVADPEVICSEPLGPSDVAVPNRDRKPKTMTFEDISQVIGEFALAAKRAKLAGFDAVEIHAAHAYLLTQFLSPLTNKRTDKYGGNHENRARLLLEVVDAVQHQVGLDFPIFVRLGCSDGIDGGIKPEDAAKTAHMLEKAGVALIDVSGAFIGAEPNNPMPGYFVSKGFAIKKRINIPLMVTGGITEPSLAQSILVEGKADLVGIGRALLNDLDWALKARKILKR